MQPSKLCNQKNKYKTSKKFEVKHNYRNLINVLSKKNKASVLNK